MRKRYVMCLVFLLLINTVSFAGLSGTDKRMSTSSSDQKYTYNSGSVDLKLPTYEIKLNGERVDNGHLEYPFLTYKGVTYMPLTYNLSRCLGVETTWTADKGLAVAFTNVSSEYAPQIKKTANAKSVKAQFPKYQVTVNGTALSSNDAYPCFVYKNIVYLPLTSTLAQNELNIKMQYSDKTGLALNALNPIVKGIKVRTESVASDWPEIALVYNDHLYYIDDNKQIMVRPVNSLEGALSFESINEKMSPLIDDSWSNAHVSSFEVKSDSVLITYHVGGATMGSDYLYKLFEDGTSEQLSESYDIVVEFDDFDIKYWGGMFGGGPLYIQYKSSSEKQKNEASTTVVDDQYTQIGSEDIMCGWYWHEHNGASGGGPSGPVIQRGDALYTLGYDRLNGDHTSIYKVNYKTNEMEALIDRDVKTFTAVGDDLYYKTPVSELKDAIYHYNINTQKDEMVFQSEGHIWYYEFIGKHLYYVTGDQQFKMVLDDKKSQPLVSTEGSICEGLKQFDANEPYFVSVFTENTDSKYRIMVFNQDEEVVFKTSDYAELYTISIDGDILYYINKATGNLCSVSLKK